MVDAKTSLLELRPRLVHVSLIGALDEIRNQASDPASTSTVGSSLLDWDQHINEQMVKQMGPLDPGLIFKGVPNVDHPNKHATVLITCYSKLFG